jgi:hypothetical protein
MCLKLEREHGKDSPTVISDPDSRQLGSYDSIVKTPVNPGPHTHNLEKSGKITSFPFVLHSPNMRQI